MSQNESNTIHEKLLVLRAQDRDQQAFSDLVKLYERKILYYICRLLSYDANVADVMQEIWIRVFLRITTLRAPEAFRVWLYKIAHDAVVDQLRKDKRQPLTSLVDSDTEQVAATLDSSEYELFENAELVHAALEKMSLPHREVLTLRFLEELELSEIAVVTSCNVGTVKSRLHYAKAAMRNLLETKHHE